MPRQLKRGNEPNKASFEMRIFHSKDQPSAGKNMII
jgi:hypothetical protein